MNEITTTKEKSIIPLSGDEKPHFDREQPPLPGDLITDKIFAKKFSTLDFANSFRPVLLKSKEILDAVYNRKNYKSGLKNLFSLIKEEFDFKEKLSLEEKLKQEQKKKKLQENQLSKKMKM